MKARILQIAIPPAWRNVWICPDADGHILAVGEDDRGRKQYIYHEKWRALRDLLHFYRPRREPSLESDERALLAFLTVLLREEFDRPRLLAS